MPKQTKKDLELDKELIKLTEDLQRVQADFINYRRRVDEERKAIMDSARAATITKLLPVIDNIELATKHVPAELAENSWAKGIASLNKGLEKALTELNLKRIEASPGTIFNPNLHEAVVMEDSEGDEEVISEELRPGYQLGSLIVRHSMVKVKNQPTLSSAKPSNDDSLSHEAPEPATKA